MVTSDQRARHALEENARRSRIGLLDFRFRGLVYAPGVPRAVHDHDDTEERIHLGDGWYWYLLVDM